MAITRYSFRTPTAPFADFEEMSNRLSQFFEGPRDEVWRPTVDVVEYEDALVLTAELPGMKEDDINIHLEDNVLTVSGERQTTRTEGEESRRYHVWERRVGAFARKFTLPSTVNAEEIRATYENGILEIRLPKVAEAKPRTIKVETRAND